MRNVSSHASRLLAHCRRLSWSPRKLSWAADRSVKETNVARLQQRVSSCGGLANPRLCHEGRKTVHLSSETPERLSTSALHPPASIEEGFRCQPSSDSRGTVSRRAQKVSEGHERHVAGQRCSMPDSVLVTGTWDVSSELPAGSAQVRTWPTAPGRALDPVEHLRFLSFGRRSK
ncbi:hypothetical protein GN956_G20564 [Arapaima gigas]